MACERMARTAHLLNGSGGGKNLCTTEVTGKKAAQGEIGLEELSVLIGT